MPTYEYVCAVCGPFEFFQSMKDAPLTTCPQCRGSEIKRLISGGAGVIFKGTGFYETDYKRKTDSSSGSKPSGTASAAESPKKESPVAAKTAGTGAANESAQKKD